MFGGLFMEGGDEGDGLENMDVVLEIIWGVKFLL